MARENARPHLDTPGPTLVEGTPVREQLHAPGIRAIERRRRLRDTLMAAAEGMIRRQGLSGLRARELAKAAGCAVGAIYNVFPDLDGLVLAVNAGTLDRIDAAVGEAGQAKGPTDPIAQLVALGQAYLAFAVAEPHLWRALFEHRLPAGAAVPIWYREQQARLFGHLDRPLATLMPAADEAERHETARMLFSGVHGVVTLGIEEKLGALPARDLRDQVGRFIVTFCRGLMPNPVDWFRASADGPQDP